MMCSGMRVAAYDIQHNDIVIVMNVNINVTKYCTVNNMFKNFFNINIAVSSIPAAHSAAAGQPPASGPLPPTSARLIHTDTVVRSVIDHHTREYNNLGYTTSSRIS